MKRKLLEVAMYKGEEFLFAGTIDECAAYRNVKPETIRFYLTKTYQRRVAKRKRNDNSITVFRLDEEGDVVDEQLA